MKRVLLTVLLGILAGFGLLQAQDQPMKPSHVITGVFLGETPALRDIPALTPEEFHLLELKGELKALNPKLKERHYPYASTAMPDGPDPVWQQTMGKTGNPKALSLAINGQTSPYYPPDANGAAGPNHYMQTINVVYTIYDKASGTLLAGPTALNTLFNGVTGSNYNDGDPICLYDEQADRWLVAEFSVSGSNDYMLVAVSTTNDPTGTWYAYSFDVADMPDYEKFGIWQDGYYMGTNTGNGSDIYVFERAQMLAGGTARAVAFDNPWRPTTIDGFHCVPPVDNDGAFAPAGSPGLFITLNDDAIGGGSDQLWIYELDVDWSVPSNSTFARVQQLTVPAFDSNFGNNWDNIKQPGTTRELDAIPMVIMNAPQYRNFGTHETLVCCHTVDVDATDHAGIRWYELRRSSGTWTLRQSGTYAPDEHSRWMGSIAMNGNGEIGLGYSVSSTTVYPGIRYCGQSQVANAAGNGVLDIAEEVIQSATSSQTSYNRWGDYSSICVDPANDHTFWFTTQYGGSRQTKIAAFDFTAPPLNAQFTASSTNVAPGSTVSFMDQSSGAPTSWSWSFPGGTPSSSTAQNPSVTYSTLGTYSVTLEVSDGTGTDIETRTDYITVAEQQLVYCSSQGNNSSYEWISSVSIGSFTNSSGAAGYTDFTNLTVPLVAGTLVDVHLVPGFSGSTYVEFWRIWIDYNKDGDFEDAGEMVFAPASTSLSIMGNFTVQAGASGTTRMRVSMKWNAEPTSCETFSYGEVEDYTVSFGTPPPPLPVPDCTTPVSPVNGATEVSLGTNLQWNPAAEATGYILYFGTDNPPTNMENGTNLGNVTTYDPAGDLSYSTTYYWKIVPYNANGSAQGCGVWSFSTLANPFGPVELSFTDFESGWGIWTDGGNDCSLYTGGTYASGGSNAADVQDNSGTASSFYMTNGVDVATPGYVQIDVEFEFIGISMDKNEDFFVEYFNGSSWYTVASYKQPNHFSNNIFYAAGVSILESQYTFPTAMKIRFRCDASNDVDDVYIDNIRITASNSANPNNYLVPLNMPFYALAGEGEEPIRVYPNPVTDELNIEVKDNVKAEIYINDMQGRVVHHSIFTGEQQVINMESFRTGLYTVLVITPEEFLRTKVVKR